MVTASQLNSQARRTLVRATRHHEDDLRRAYEIALAFVGREYASRFTRLATDAPVAVAAAGLPTKQAAPWVPPPGPQLYGAVAAPGPVKRIHQIQERIVQEMMFGFSVGVAFDVIDPPTQALVNGLGARVEGVLGAAATETVQASIARSYAEGDTIVEAARGIRAAVKEAKPWQAVMLARTDLIGIANGSTLIHARAVNAAVDGTPFLTKKWVATNDNRTRETHRDAHDQEVPIGSTFTVGLAHLDYPGDPEGPDGEVINCRCTLLILDRPTTRMPDLANVASAVYVEAEHPRYPSGQREGGRWRPKGAGWASPAVRPSPMFVHGREQAWSGRVGQQQTNAEKHAERHGMTVDEYKAAIEVRLAEDIENSYLATRVPIDVLDDIVLDDERIKSQFETGTSMGSLNNKMRADSELTMFGYPRALDPEDRPIYGFLTKPNSDAGVYAKFYGPVEIEYRHQVRDRATFTGGDSLSLAYVPSPLTDPSYLSVAPPWWGNHEDFHKDVLGNGLYGVSSPYVEAQIHGGVTLDDIAAVTLPAHYEDIVENGETLPSINPQVAENARLRKAVAKLEEHGITVEYR